METTQTSGNAITRRGFTKKSVFGALVAANSVLLTGLVNADTTSTVTGKKRDLAIGAVGSSTVSAAKAIEALWASGTNEQPAQVPNQDFTFVGSCTITTTTTNGVKTYTATVTTASYCTKRD